jgi:NAD(P)-dependent dehydrogenase (short-subunit alcohol dehydrogenase family)
MTDTAVVTGADAGLGRAVALALGGVGATVVLGGRDADDLEAVQAAVESGGGTGVAVRSDARDEFDHERLMETAARTAGPIDVLVAAEAVSHDSDGRHPLPAVSYSAFDDVVRTNLRGPFSAIREAVPHLAADGTVLVLLPVLGDAGAEGSRPVAIATMGARGLVEVAASDLEQSVIGIEHELRVEESAEPEPDRPSDEETARETVAAAVLEARDRAAALDGRVVAVADLGRTREGG